MSTEYSPFAKPKFTAEHFARKETDSDMLLERPIPAAEPRSFTSDETITTTRTVEPAAGLYADEVAFRSRAEPVAEVEEPSTFAASPLYTQRASTKKASTGRSIHPAALVAIPAVAILAGVGYFAMQPRGDGLMTSTAPAPVAAAPATPVVPATPAPVAATPAAAAPSTMTPEPVQAQAPAARAEAPARTARARPAAAPVPADPNNPATWASDTSATIPDAPIPYSAGAQTSAPAPAPIAAPPVTPPATVDAAPTTATPAPEPAAPAPDAAPAAEAPAPTPDAPTPQ